MEARAGIVRHGLSGVADMLPGMSEDHAEKALSNTLTITGDSTHPLFELHAHVHVDATPAVVYEVISDITRMGEWSPENDGGEWIAGVPGTVGARFRGHNSDRWRCWTTECEVLAAEAPHRFAWGVSSPVDATETSVWSFEIEPRGAGCLLTQRYVLTQFREGLRRMTEGLSAEQTEAFLRGRRDELQEAMNRTVRAVRDSVESG